MLTTNEFGATPTRFNCSTYEWNSRSASKVALAATMVVAFESLSGSVSAQGANGTPQIDTLRVKNQPGYSQAAASDSQGRNPTQSENPALSSDLFPTDLELESSGSGLRENMKPIPCLNGQISTTIKLLHPKGGPAVAGQGLLAQLVVRTGKDNVWVGVNGNYAIGTMESARFGATNAKRLNGSGDTYVGPPGAPVAVSISWNSSGLITVSARRIGTGEFLMNSGPKELALMVSGGSAKFSNLHLSCVPIDETNSSK